MLSYSGKILSQFFSQSYGTILPLCYQLEAVHPRAVLAFTYVQLNLHVLDIVLDIGKSVQNLSKIVQNLPLIVQLPNTGLWMPAGIGIVNRKSASDVITIKTKIIASDSTKTMVVPKTIFDTGSDSSLVSSNIVKRLELIVDKTNAPDLSGVATKSDTMGTTYGLGISIYDSDNDKTIEDDFMVIKSDKDFLLLGVPWIDRAKAILDCGNRQL